MPTERDENDARLKKGLPKVHPKAAVPGTPDHALERKIGQKFEEIADCDWFPETVEVSSIQLPVLWETLKPGLGMKILDAGCARGRFARALSPSGAELYGVDLTETFLRTACRNAPEARLCRGSLSALPFETNTFEAVYCIEVLQHLPDTGLALSEMARVLKPGGTLLIIDKNLLGLWPGVFLPNFIVKPWKERRGSWMYPPNFSFRERWFRPFRLARRMRAFFSFVDVRFLTGHGRVTLRICRLFPMLSHEVCWIGKK